VYKLSEQRKHARITNPYITRFRVNSNENMIYKDWDMVAIVNLSAGGIFFYTVEKLQVGTILDLKIGFSYTHPSMICIGRIIRAKQHLDTSIIGFAIQFTEIDKHVIELINDTAKKNIK
jgi:hypothetical protein